MGFKGIYETYVNKLVIYLVISLLFENDESSVYQNPVAMALSNELPVYVETYHYIQAVIDTQKNFPRDVKHTVGQEWIKIAISLPTFIVKANMFKSEREAYLTDFICEFEHCKLIVRLAGDNRWISRKQQSNLMYLEATIGKQVTAWKNASKKRYRKRTSADEDD